MASIAGKRLIFPFEGLTLHHVLHVPRISYNLMYISKLTCELNFTSIFLPDSVSFQDLSLERMIGTT